MKELLQDAIEARVESISHEPPLRLLEMDDEQVSELFKALAGDTSREIYQHIQQSPATAPQLADTLDTTVQNIHYHFEKLRDAGLIEPLDTTYSEKGIEMTVYGAAFSPLIISFATEEEQQRLRSTLARGFSAVFVLSLLSLLVTIINQFLVTPRPNDGDTSGGPNPIGEVLETVLASPGAMFFIGGAALLILVFGWRFYTQPRP